VAIEPPGAEVKGTVSDGLLRSTGTRGTLIAAGLIAAVVLAAAGLLAAGAPRSRTPILATSPSASAPSLASLAASRGIGSDQRAFWATRNNGALVAVNGEQRMRTTFSAAGVRISVPGGNVGLEFRAGGEAVSPVARANRVTYARGGAVEWYANGPLGLEQGLTLRAPPVGSGGELGLSFALSGAAARLQDGQLVFHGAAGKPILRYSGLSATDADGKVLGSSLQLDGSRLTIRVDDRGARYPITIDPLIQVATVGTSDSAQGSEFGYNVAISGSTLVVGDSSHQGGIGSEILGEPADTSAGAVYVFNEPASGWAHATQVAKLTASATNPSDYLGESIAISGSTIYAVGTNTAGDGDSGDVYVFAEPKGGWTSSETETALLTPPQPADNFSAVAVSPSSGGDTVFAGAPAAGTFDGTNDDFPGAVYVFKEPAGGWTPGATGEAASAVLTSSDAGGGLGGYLAISGDTLVAGAPTAGSQRTGAAYVFKAPWTTGHETARLTAPDFDSQATLFPGGSLGAGVATDGTTIVVAAPEQGSGTTVAVGAVYIYALPKSGVWATTATPTAELTPTAEPVDTDGFYHLFGIRLAIGQYFTDATDSSAPTGQTAETVFVGTGDGTGIYAFTEPASGWKSVAAAPVLGLASASAFSLTLDGGYLLEGADHSLNEYAAPPATPTYLPGTINVFDTPSGGTLPSGPSGPPANIVKPAISGTAKAGDTLSCSQGSWTNDPTGFAYLWNIDGTPVPGATSSKYKVQSGDEQLTLTCGVTASNAKGSGSATSKGKTVPVPHVARCPAASGKLSGDVLGVLRLGMTRAQALHAFKHSSTRGKKYEIFFCLTPRGVRVGIASPKLVKTLPKSERGLGGHVIWASTSSFYYSVKGVRCDTTVAAAKKRLKLTGPFHIGKNYWYLAPNGSSTAVFKVRGGVIQEIGIGSKKLTTGHKAQVAFLTSFS
jgi:FG-GAP repeat